MEDGPRLSTCQGMFEDFRDLLFLIEDETRRALKVWLSECGLCFTGDGEQLKTLKKFVQIQF